MKQMADPNPTRSMATADVANGEAGALESSQPPPGSIASQPAELRSVTFRTEPAQHGEEVCVVGDFNDWSLSALPMVRVDDHFEATVELVPGRAYRYRYLFDGHRWENDWHADRYEKNSFGGEDAVVDLADTVP